MEVRCRLKLVVKKVVSLELHIWMVIMMVAVVAKVLLQGSNKLERVGNLVVEAEVMLSGSNGL